MFNEYKKFIETLIIFILMGVFSVIIEISNKKEEINFGKLFQKFYMNIIAGWGVYSLLIGYQEWFGNYPQKVFIIMTVVLTGVKTFDYIKDNNVIGRVIESIMLKK